MTSHYDRETLIDYLHGALAPDTDADVFAHLEGCSACRALHDDEAGFGEALRAAARADERELPAMVKARVWDAVRRERPTLRARFARVWGPMIAVPVAAAVALGVYLGVPTLHASAPPPGISAIEFLAQHNAETQQNPLGFGVAPTVYGPEAQAPTAAASYIDTADAATLDDADAAYH
jgi:predicted anti-sigma-YlaC factor YlaD